MSRWLGLVLLLILSAGEAAASERILIAVGNNRGLTGETNLRFAAADAQRFAAVFTSLGDVPEPRARVLADQSVGTLRDTLAELARAPHSEEADMLVFYFSGHGSEGAIHLDGEPLPIEEILDDLGRVPAKLRLLVIDACRSREGQSKGLVEDAPFAIALDASPTSTGMVTIRSSSQGEAAQESRALGGAVFTHYLVSALRGAADDDGDKRVTFEEAYAYAYDRTLRRSAASQGTLQHPSLDLAVTKSGRLVLTRTGQARSHLVLPPGSDQQYLVYRMPTGLVMAEVWADPSSPVTLALPAGRFLIQRKGGQRFAAAEVALPYGGTAQVEVDEFESIEAAAITDKGGRAVLKRHRLWAGYDLTSGPHASVGHGARFRYDLLFSDLALVASAQLSRTPYQTATFDVTESSVGGDLAVELRFFTDPVELRAGAGGHLRLIEQGRERLDADRFVAAGGDPEASASALAGGPMIRLGADVPLAYGLWAGAGLRGLGLFHRLQTTQAFRPLLSGELVLGFEL